MKSILVDNRISTECERELSRLGFTVMKLPAFKGLPAAIESHADTLFFRMNDELFTYADYCESAAYIFSDLRYFYPKVNIHFTSDKVGERYPEDCRFNALCMNGRLFAKMESISESVSELCRRQELRAVNVKQGYPACSVLRLDETHAVTADKGLSKVLQKNGITVTEISAGGIELLPYEYGFIGGACCVFGNTVYFFGDYRQHPDSDRIKEAARDLNMKLHSLAAHPLVDLGGALFFE